MFLDGVLVFDDLSFFLKVHTLDYQDIMNTFRPRIEIFAKNFYSMDKFNKYCFFIINHSWVNSLEKEKGKEFSALIFCLNSDTTDEQQLASFPEDFRLKYSKALVSSEDFLSLQQYRLKQNIQIQFYDPHITLEEIRKQSKSTGQSSAVGGLPTLYTSFSNEGLVMNTNKNHNPLGVKYSFRYDQVIKCRGEHPEELKKNIKPEISMLFRPEKCCISYIVDFNNTCSMAMFCSSFLKDWKCEADIKIFRSTMYKRCLIEKIENVEKKVQKIKTDKANTNVSFLNKAALIYGLRETMNKKMMENIEPTSTLGKILMKIGLKNKDYESEVLATLKPDCEEVYKKLAKKEQNKKQNEMKSKLFYDSILLKILKNYFNFFNNFF